MCPNKSHPDYKKLVDELEKEHPGQGDEYAHLAWIRHGENDIPTGKEAVDLLSNKNTNEPEYHGDVGNALKKFIDSGEAKTAKDALNIIANNGGEFQKLAVALLNHNPNGLDAVIGKKTAGTGSDYSSGKHLIRINELYKDNPRTYIHEIIHALTSRELVSQIGDELNDTSASSKGSLIYDDKVNKVIKSDRVSQPVKDLLTLFLKAKAELVKDSGFPEDHYGLTNIHEFVAEAFSNTEFQERLNTLKGINGKSVWQNFLDAIKSMLGFSVKQGSVLDETLRASLDLSKQKSESRDKYTKQGTFKETLNSPESEKFSEDQFHEHLTNEDFKTTKAWYEGLGEDDRKYLDSQYNGDALKFAKDSFENHGGDTNLLSTRSDADSIPLTGKANDAVKARQQVVDNVKRLQSKAIEQPLVNKEPIIKSQFKNIKVNFLNDQDLATYHALLDNFVNSRSRTQDPTADRVSVEELQPQLIDLKKKSDQGAFDYFANEYPEGFSGKTFDDFGNNIDLVNQYVQQIVNSSEFEDEAAKTPQARLDTEDIIRDIQQRLIDNGGWDTYKDKVGLYTNLEQLAREQLDNSPRAKEMYNSDSVFKDSIEKYFTVLREHGLDSENIIKQIFDYAVNTEPSELPTYADVRKLKYLTQAMSEDGYFPFINTFISNELQTILNTKGIDFKDPNKSNAYKFTRNIESIAAMTGRVAPGKEASHFITALGVPIRDSYNRAQRAHVDFLLPFTEAVNKKWEKENGSKFTNREKNQMGMMAMMRQRYLDETHQEALAANLKWMNDSFANHENSNIKAERDAATDGKNFIKALTEGVSLESDEDQRPQMEKNFERLVSPEALGYIKDSQQIFELTKPIARMASEFGYGKEFNEIENYFPSFTLPTSSAYETNKSVFHFSETDILTPIESAMLGSKAAANINASRNGMSSIKLRERVVPEGRRLVFNIDNMIVNRGRLNLLDGFTALRRKEMANVLKSKQLSYFLGDFHQNGDKILFDQRGRTAQIKRAFNQEWMNMIQSNSYLGTFQTVLNALTRRFSVAKLASLYRAPVHILGNFTSYLVENPGRSFDLLKSYAAMAEAHRDPNYKNFLDRLFFESRKRSQDVTLDRSTNINIGLEGQGTLDRMWEGVKDSKVFQGIGKVDEAVQKVLFAPLKWSDQSSGNAIMLTEFLHNERERLNNPNLQFKDLVLNDKSGISYQKSLNTMERHVTIGDASRRGMWLNNTNGAISLLRNLTVAFAGKKIMNATNFGVAMHNLINGSMSSADKAATVRFMGAIAMQTAVFQMVKWTLQGLTGNAITSVVRSNQDDALEQLYRKQVSDDSLTPRQKVQLEQEISARRKIRAAFTNMDNKNFNGSTLAIDTVKDTLPNMFLIPSLLGGQVDGVIHMVWDQHEQATFQQMKQAELDRLRTVKEQAKENGNINLYAQAAQKESDLQSQKAQLVVNQHQSYQNLTGIIGEFLNENHKFGTAALGSVYGTHEIMPSDIGGIMSAYGVGTSETSQFFRLQDEVNKAHGADDQKIQQKYEKLQKKGQNY